MRRLQIEIGERGGFDVIDEYGQRSGLLTLGEMIEQVLSIAQVRHPTPRYPMATEEDWAAQAAASYARGVARREAEAATEQAMQDALRQWAAAERMQDPKELETARAERDRLLAPPVDEFADVPF